LNSDRFAYKAVKLSIGPRKSG